LFGSAKANLGVSYPYATGQNQGKNQRIFPFHLNPPDANYPLLLNTPIQPKSFAGFGRPAIIKMRQYSKIGGHAA
jgi:hypothetical protein